LFSLKAQIDATFPDFARLKAKLDTPDFPSDQVSKATRNYLDLMEYRAKVLWQDLAVLRVDMPQHQIFTVSPFNNNAHGFYDFERRQTEAVNAAPSQVFTEATEAARVRNDHQTAGVLASLQSALTQQQPLLALGQSPARLLRETHHAVTSRAPLALPGLAVGPPMHTVAPSPADAAVPSATTPSEPATWPTVAADGLLPSFAASYEFRSVASLALLQEEWVLGLLSPGGGDRGPPVRELEEHYGPLARNGKGAGCSWRSKQLHGGSQRVDNAFNKRKPFFSVVELEGNAGVERLQDTVTEEFGEEATSAPCWTQVKWLLEHLKKQSPSYEAHRKRGADGAAKSKKRNRKSATTGT